MHLHGKQMVIGLLIPPFQFSIYMNETFKAIIKLKKLVQNIQRTFDQNHNRKEWI